MSKKPFWGDACQQCKHEEKEYNEEPCWTCINSGIINRVKWEPKSLVNQNSVPAKETKKPK